MADVPLVPPVVELGKLAGWSPLPLSVRDARRAAGDLRSRLAEREPRRRTGRGDNKAATSVLARIRHLLVSYPGGTHALRGVDLDLHAREIVALMGRNGAGKSTLLGSLVSLVRPTSGRVQVADLTPYAAKPAELIRHVGLVPQEPADLLYADTVAVECATADRDAGVEDGTCRTLFERLAPGVPDDRHPRDLSEGQRLTLALAIVLTVRPELVLLDEPTRGLDYTAKRRLVATLRELRADGHGVVLATHDVELVAEVADRVVVLGDGEVVADGPTAEVIVASPAFAPQVAKVLAPLSWLTVDEVADALGAAS
jgi:energy-coupling factor transport system ATP-binding protein